MTGSPSGSSGLVRTAAALHLHRNTLLYRLAKIEKPTDRSIRDHRSNLALYVACLADQLDEQPAPARG